MGAVELDLADGARVAACVREHQSEGRASGGSFSGIAIQSRRSSGDGRFRPGACHAPRIVASSPRALEGAVAGAWW